MDWDKANKASKKKTNVTRESLHMRNDAAERWLSRNDKQWRKKRKKKNFEEMMWNRRQRKVSPQ